MFAVAKAEAADAGRLLLESEAAVWSKGGRLLLVMDANEIVSGDPNPEGSVKDAAEEVDPGSEGEGEGT